MPVTRTSVGSACLPYPFPGRVIPTEYTFGGPSLAAGRPNRDVQLTFDTTDSVAP